MVAARSLRTNMERIRFERVMKICAQLLIESKRQKESVLNADAAASPLQKGHSPFWSVKPGPISF